MHGQEYIGTFRCCIILVSHLHVYKMCTLALSILTGVYSFLGQGASQWLSITSLSSRRHRVATKASRNMLALGCKYWLSCSTVNVAPTLLSGFALSF